MRRPTVKTMRALLAGLVVAVYALLADGEVAARLSVIPGRPGAPRPTSPQPTPVTPPGGSPLAACQATIAAESARMLGELRTALGDCLARGVRCLVDEAGSVACCDEAALVCQGELVRMANATRRFRETVRAGACAAVPLAELQSGDGLGFDASACARLVPPVAVTDHASFADCLQLLLGRDVMHQVGLTDVPRAPEAVVCMGLEEVLGDVLGADPATCEPSPTPVPTATPAPTPSSGQGAPTPTAAGPTPTPTPSPGPNGCQPRLLGPCHDGTFTACCATNQACVSIFSPSDGSGVCVTSDATPTPQPSTTPTPSAAPTGAATPTLTPPTGTPAATPTALPTLVPPTPAATPQGTPQPTSGGPTPTLPPACSTVTVTVNVSYAQTEFPDVAGMTINLGYPATVVIPGFGAEPSVVARVTNLTGVSGIFSMGDQDTAINVGLVSLASAVPPGNFVRIVFDCVGGAAAPDAGAFMCTPDVSTVLGSQVDATCSVAVTTP